MVHSGDVRLILGARHPMAFGESLQLDLTALASVRSFAMSLWEQLGEIAIDGLVLNAGMNRHDDTERTVDGFETTLAVNHLAHYLMLRLSLSSLADNAIVVMTTSGTHDPATKAGLITPRHSDAEWLAHPDRDSGRDHAQRKAGEHAYTASELCTVLTARLVSEFSEVRTRRITVIAYDPGQVFGTGLAKDLSFPMRLAWSLFGTPVLGPPLRRLNSTLNSRHDAGNTLADLVLGHVRIPKDRFYAALRRGKISWPDPSELARNDDGAQRLWASGARLAGLPDTLN
jgi:NAD(P)-dependent dehydrogenase (short-subunit alcohol dehydrogenase family)